MPWFLKSAWCDIRVSFCFIRKIRQTNGKIIIEKKAIFCSMLRNYIFSSKNYSRWWEVYGIVSLGTWITLIGKPVSFASCSLYIIHINDWDGSMYWLNDWSIYWLIKKNLIELVAVVKKKKCNMYVFDKFKDFCCLLIKYKSVCSSCVWLV